MKDNLLFCKTINKCACTVIHEQILLQNLVHAGNLPKALATPNSYVVDKLYI